MKIIIAIMLMLIIGCAGFQVSDTTTHKAIAYGAGRAMAVGIYELNPLADEDLTSAWVEMMDRNRGLPEISPDEMMIFYNKSLMLMTAHTKDPYGLIGDLGYLLTIFGAEFDPDNNMMIGITAVPMSVMVAFEIGYANSRAMLVP